MKIITLIAGLVASYLFLCALFKKVTVEKFIVFFSAIFFLLTISTGYLYKQFDVSLTPYTFLIAYSAFAVLFWLIKKEFCYFTFGRRDILTICLFLVSIIFYLYPSLPHLSPSCYAGDCTTHMQLMAYIYDKHSFMKEIDYGFASLKVYPFGIHLITAILGIFLKIHPLILVSIVLSVISALSLLAAYGITKELAENKLIPVIAGILVLLSIYPLSALSAFGFYAQILGNLFSLVFLWTAKDYIESKGLRYLLFSGLLFFGMTHSFSLYIPIIGATMLLVFIFEGGAIKIRLKHALFFFFLTCLIFWKYFFVDIPAGSGQNPGTLGLLNLHSFFEKVGNALRTDGNITFRDTKIMVFTLPALSLLSLLISLRLKERRFLLLSLVPVFLQIVVFYFAYFYLDAGAYWYLKIFYLLIYPMAILSALFLDSLFAKFWKFPYGSIPPLLIIVCLVALPMIFPSTIDSRSASGNNMWITPMKELLRYNRSGNVPELISISDWMKKSLPEHARVYYNGPYNPCWLYAISRNRIMTEEGANVDSIPEDLLLFRTQNGAIYRKPFSGGSKIGSCYKLELDYIFPERELLPPPPGMLSYITDKWGDALNARGENVPEVDIVSANVTQPVKGIWKFALTTSGKIPIGPPDLPEGNYIQYQFGVDADQNPLTPGGNSVSIGGPEYVIDIFIDPLYTPPIRASLCVVAPFRCTSLPVVTVAGNRASVQVPQGAMEGDLLFDWSVYGAVAGGGRSAGDANNRIATVQ